MFVFPLLLVVFGQVCEECLKARLASEQAEALVFKNKVSLPPIPFPGPYTRDPSTRTLVDVRLHPQPRAGTPAFLCMPAVLSQNRSLSRSLSTTFTLPALPPSSSNAVPHCRSRPRQPHHFTTCLLALRLFLVVHRGGDGCDDGITCSRDVADGASRRRRGLRQPAHARQGSVAPGCRRGSCYLRERFCRELCFYRRTQVTIG